jgi:hypothetical protein
MRKNLMIAAAAATISLGVITPLGMSVAAHAASNTASGSSIVDKIASKFNLNKSDVQKVFDENRAAHNADRQQAEINRLATLVKDGKITQDQSEKIAAKQAEMKAQMEANRASMQSMTEVERKAAREATKVALEKWSSDNGIDIQYLMPAHGGPNGGGHSHAM